MLSLVRKRPNDEAGTMKVESAEQVKDKTANECCLSLMSMSGVESYTGLLVCFIAS